MVKSFTVIDNLEGRDVFRIRYLAYSILCLRPMVLGIIVLKQL